MDRRTREARTVRAEVFQIRTLPGPDTFNWIATGGTGHFRDRDASQGSGREASCVQGSLVWLKEPHPVPLPADWERVKVWDGTPPGPRVRTLSFNMGTRVVPELAVGPDFATFGFGPRRACCARRLLIECVGSISGSRTCPTSASAAKCHIRVIGVEPKASPQPPSRVRGSGEDADPSHPDNER
jgi:hypothetical protein